MAPTIVIAAGGTAGHVVPALAVADALRAEGARVVFVGGERAERTMVPAAGYELRPIAVEGLSRSNPLKAARAALRAATAVGAARGILRDMRPDAVLGAGGYVAGPVGLAAVARRVPIVLAEADSHLGLTNRLLARWARRVCLAFPIAGRDGERYLVTGRPVPPPATDRAAARARFGLAPDETCVLVFGGSLGARTINEAAVEGLAGADFRVLHACGARDYEALRHRLGPAPPANYELREFISPFGEALLASDLCVARAGGSIFEIAAHGRPAILVPYPFAAADHQTANAEWMRRAGAAVVVPDAQLGAERLAREVGELLGDPGRLRAMGRAAAGLARPDAAAAIAHELIAAARVR
jgi:UDP-N-acetylglucosamine--N-acetylmuramyl-(pentapeptide) pyrophosphoryl-undecaprenol N-acetylglucosamine transferase